jgi:hypothetical protein
MLTFSDVENSKNFECKNCNFVCSRKFEWVRHINTLKHTKMLTNVDKKVQNVDAKSAKSAKKCKCSCGKVFMHRQSLSLHRKKYNCESSEYNEFDIQTADLNDKELISYLMKENSEFKSMLLEQNKMMMNIVQNSNSSISNTINQTNSHNKTFNLQFFLNETCKDAMNISEFIENISLQLADLENMGQYGYIEGISNIIIKNLRALDVEKRPVHCSDIKREIMYVKDQDKWEKENDEKQKIKQVISAIAHKNRNLLPEYQKKYPECMNPESKKSDEYNHLIMESLGIGTGTENTQSKIIRKIAKEVVIEKE